MFRARVAGAPLGTVRSALMVLSAVSALLPVPSTPVPGPAPLPPVLPQPCVLEFCDGTSVLGRGSPGSQVSVHFLDVLVSPGRGLDSYPEEC